MREEIKELRNRWHGERRIESKEFRKRVSLEKTEHLKKGSDIEGESEQLKNTPKE